MDTYGMLISYIKKELIDADVNKWTRDKVFRDMDKLEAMINERDRKIKEIENELNYRSSYIHLSQSEYEELKNAKRVLETINSTNENNE